MKGIIVISQPMLFPWVGLIEQARLAEHFVHYDDVQMPLGRSLMQRVQIKAANGITWLTVPILRNGKQLIKDVKIDDSQNWRSMHLKTLQHAYSKAKCFNEMLSLVELTYKVRSPWLCDITIESLERITQYFGLLPSLYRSSSFAFASSSSQHLLDIVLKLSGSVYVTGHGAKNYLEHDLFVRHGIDVQYMDYKKIPYPQIHGAFTPYVSALDLIANMGKEGSSVIASSTVGWKDFCNTFRPHATQEIT